MFKVFVLACFFLVAFAQVIPDGTPRLSGAGYVTTNCQNLQLGQEPPFPNNYLDEINNYLYPNIRLLQSQRELAGDYKRTFHFPTIGCVNATFTVNQGLSPNLAVGIFQPGVTYPAFLRFSGFNQLAQNVTGGDTKGLAIKLYNVPGRKLLPGFETDTHHDFVFNAVPVFTSNNETVFSALVMSQTQIAGGSASAAGKALFAADYPIPANRSAQEHINNTVSTVLQMPFFAISPFRFGLNPLPNPAVKYRVFPCGGVVPSINYTGATVDYLTVDMTTRLATTAYCFYFQLQFQKDTCLHPINDFGVEWLEADTPYITVATINIPAQTVLTDTDPTCKFAAFNVWRVLPEHRPLGSLNRARMFAMMNSQNQRFALDNVVEPVTLTPHPGLQFLLPSELGINTNFTPAQVKVNFPGNPVLFQGGPSSAIYTAPPALPNSASGLVSSFFLVLALLVLLF